MNADLVLFKEPPEYYDAERYQAQLLEQYKICVEMADRISARRQTANTFFLTLNTALLAFLGLVVEGEGRTTPLPWALAISGAGLILCYAWYRLVASYRSLNSGKFKVIHAIEHRLRVAPFEAEWEALGRGKDASRHLPFTRVERRVPWIFAALYGAFAAWHVVRYIG
jgi:hypothetical protein